ncbi:MAG: EI24 domain-containing protein, partial [Bacteroidota bacterium]
KLMTYLGGLWVLFTLYKYLVMIFTATLMSMLSEEVENDLSGHPSRQVGFSSMIKEIIRGASIAGRNLLIELGLTLVIFVIGAVLGMTPIAAIVVLLIQAYYAGFGNLDFWAERHLNHTETIRFMRDHRGMCIANGGVFLLLLSIPIVGAFLAPPFATIAGTIHAHRYQRP